MKPRADYSARARKGIAFRNGRAMLAANLSDGVSMPSHSSIRPGRWLYLVGFFLMLAGFGIFVGTFVRSILHVTKNMKQVLVPGEADLELQPQAEYMVFAERQSVLNGKVYDTQGDISKLECRVKSKATGKYLHLTRPPATTTYSSGQRRGNSAFAFMSEEAGTYHFSCDYYPEDYEGPEVVMAVGAGVDNDMVMAMAVGFGSIFVLGGAGVILLIAVYVLRARAKKNQQTPRPLADTPR
jgi:hypothetical protein